METPRHGSLIGLFVLAAGCTAANENPGSSGFGGNNSQGAGSQVSAAGMGPRAGDAGGGAAGASTGGASTAAAGSSGANQGGDGGGTGGSAAGGGSGGSGGSAGGGGMAGSGFTYEPITDDEFDEIPLFEGDPPNLKSGAPAETVNQQGSIGNVSVPTLRRFAMDGSKATGFGYVVLPGGAYTGLDMDTHATRLAERLGPLGIAVFAVKYRVGGGSNDAPRDALLDAKRAMRLVKHHAARWAVAPERVGVIGYSAGSHLALSLAGSFDAGDTNASDPIEQQSSRPAFVGSMSTWAFYRPESPFTFSDGVPPVYFCHAQDDTIAPIALAKTVDMQVRAKGAVTQLDFYDTGGHSTCHPGDPSAEGHDWPDKFWPWVQSAID
jgi:acetyl esterase/lipase